MINLEGVLNFLSENIYLLIIFIVLGLIAHLWGLFYADGEVKKSLFIEENMSVFFELKKCVYDAHIKSLNKI